MFSKQILFDSVMAIGLVAALSIVLVVDYNQPFKLKEYVDGEQPSERRSLIGANQQVVVRKKIQPRADSIYAERVVENRVEVAKKRGGSQISERAVRLGLGWLARHQAQEGFWSNQCLGDSPSRLCDTRKPCSGAGSDHAVGQTGMALLAFQGGGHFWFNEEEYSVRVKRGLNWLVAQQRKDGAISIDDPATQPHFMYDHAIATFALAEACATARHSDEQIDTKYFDALVKAIQYIEKAQHKYGGWRYQSGEEGDTSVSGWVVLALKTAKEAGVKISPACVDGCIRFFESCTSPEDGRTGYQGPGHFVTEATTGVGMLVHHFLLEKPDSALVQKASKYLAGLASATWGTTGQGTSDFYLWYNCTLGMYLAGGPNWDKWNNVVRRQLEASQVNDEKSCERGSWPPNDRWGTTGGRIYSTSMAILTLEVYYRFAKKAQVQ